MASKKTGLSLRKYLLIDIIIAFFIIFCTILPYFHVYIPRDNSISILGQEFPLKIYPDLQVWIYYLSVAFSSSGLLLIWLLTSHRIWSYVVVFLVSFQFHYLINFTLSQTDFFSYYTGIFPWILGFFNSVLLILLKMNTSYRNDNLNFILGLNEKTLWDVIRKPVLKLKTSEVRDLIGKDNNLTQNISSLHQVRERLSVEKNVFEQRSIKSYEWYLVLILVLCPFLPFTYTFFPKGLIQTDLLGVKIESYGYPDLQSFFWFVGFKLSFLIPLNVWYFTLNYWWKHFLLIPLTIGFYQLLSAISVSSDTVDQSELWSGLPVLIPIIILLILISSKVSKFIQLQEIIELLETRIDDSLKSIAKIQQPKRELWLEYEKLKKQEHSLTKSEYKRKLIALMKKLKE